MVKVKIVFLNKSSTEFYAYDWGIDCNDGRGVCWKSEDEKVMKTFNINQLIMFQEEETE